MSPDRPVFLNLARIRFPVGAVASIGHRISGVLLVLVLPFAIWFLEISLRSDSISLETGAFVRVGALLLGWAAAHHLFAGIRHLLMDVGVGASLPAARASAYAVLIGAAAVALAAFFL